MGAAVTQVHKTERRKPDPDCMICGGIGVYCDGKSNSETDGNAAHFEECDCYELVEEDQPNGR